MFYLPDVPFWMRMLFPPGVVWKGNPANKMVYLTFDDGPEPEVTKFVMDQLKAYRVKATFFCIGDNVLKHPEIFNALKAAGHRIGNHTMHHPNGWKTDNELYVSEVMEADKLIGSNLFRPPYGKITPGQTEMLRSVTAASEQDELALNQTVASPFKIIMWSVITGDFDQNIDGERCFQRVVKYTTPGSIIVFHDSVKAFPRLKTALPKTLKWLTQQGFQMGVIG